MRGIFQTDLILVVLVWKMVRPVGAILKACQRAVVPLSLVVDILLVDNVMKENRRWPDVTENLNVVI